MNVSLSPLTQFSTPTGLIWKLVGFTAPNSILFKILCITYDTRYDLFEDLGLRLEMMDILHENYNISTSYILYYLDEFP